MNKHTPGVFDPPVMMHCVTCTCDSLQQKGQHILTQLSSSSSSSSITSSIGCCGCCGSVSYMAVKLATKIMHYLTKSRTQILTQQQSV